MKVEFSEKFSREIHNLKQPKLKKSLLELIETAKSSQSLKEIPNTKKLKGYKNIYRARIGDYRVGLIYKNGILSFETILHRKDIYKNFP